MLPGTFAGLDKSVQRGTVRDWLCVRKSLCFINDDERIMEAVLNHAHATKLLAKFCACVAIQPG